MGEIKIGEYIRTKQGRIDRVQCEFNAKGWKSQNSYGELIVRCELDTILLKSIVNHSKQLIDLIEDKDVVEIELSEEFVEKKDKKKLIQIGDIYTKETLQKDIDNGIITRILTILSYNQYMANCYKVGEEDER